MKTLFAFMALAAGAAQAHVTLEVPQVAAGSSYKAVLRVGHGCEGSATHTLTVRLPPGFRGAKPMPKAGWQISIQRAALAEPTQSHGKTNADEVVEITWKASSREAWLPDAQYDEFILHGQAPQTPGPAWFKVLQQCEKGQLDWAELPVSGASTQGLKSPAVLLDVLPAHPVAHQH